MEMTGAQAIIECLRREGVEVIFGLPGGANLPMYDVLYDVKDIRHILVRHEQGAGHMAEGYAKATGRVGVCFATSGPGATNLVTALTDAFMDSVPIVAITGQVATFLIGRDSFQEANTTGITMPCTKHNWLVQRTEDIPQIVRQAFYIASHGRPGPVLIDVPKDLQLKKFNFEWPEKIDLPSFKPTTKGHPKQIKAAAKLIREAKRPIIYAGGGVINSGAAKELVELAHKQKIPVTTTLMGLGGFPGNDPLSIGMLGMHGGVFANYAVTECDLLIAVGARFDDRVTGRLADFASKSKKIHIDVDPAEIGKNVKIDIPIVGDVRHVIQQLIEELPEAGPARDEWHKQIEEWRNKFPLTYRKDGTKIKPQYLCEAVWEATQGDAIIATEVGQHQMWVAQYFKFALPNTFLTSGGLGTMGFGLPAAIGAQAAFPDKTVIDMAGDGSVQMTIQELTTASLYKLPIKVFIFNNGFHGMVRQWQQLIHGKRYSYVNLEGSPDFVKLAEAYGCAGFRTDKPSEVMDIIQATLKIRNKPSVVDFVIEPEENVFPFVPPGQAINEMIVD